MDLEKIFERNRQWALNQEENDKEYFKRLCKGQKPQFLYIGCSDSRVSAEELMGAKPGEVFVYRNIANIVAHLDMGVMAVVHYAVVHLQVKNIVVCGHTYCGGIKAALNSENLGILNPWLQSIRDVYRLYQKELDAIKNDTKKHTRLAELNVEEQCLNLLKIPEVQAAYQKKKISLHGFIFDIESGRLIDLKIDFQKLNKIAEKIYRIV